MVANGARASVSDVDYFDGAFNTGIPQIAVAIANKLLKLRVKWGR